MMEQARPALRPWQLGLPALAAAAGLITMYIMGIDQGQLLGVVQGSSAFEQNLLHEFVHDARHAAGFPCH